MLKQCLSSASAVEQPPTAIQSTAKPKLTKNYHLRPRPPDFHNFLYVIYTWSSVWPGLNGLLLDGTKPLPEPMLTYHQWGPKTFIWKKFHERCPNHQLLKWTWKLCWNVPGPMRFNHLRVTMSFEFAYVASHYYTERMHNVFDFSHPYLKTLEL